MKRGFLLANSKTEKVDAAKKTDADKKSSSSSPATIMDLKSGQFDSLNSSQFNVEYIKESDDDFGITHLSSDTLFDVVMKDGKVTFVKKE